MEKESKKRAREGEDEKELLETAKKQHLNKKNKKPSMMREEEEEERLKALSDNYLALGVFDFPWLKEGMVFSKSDEWKFEDTFSSSLNTYNGLEVCDTPEPQPQPLSIVVDDLRVVEGDYGLDLEGVDCFWTSLLNQPLSPPAFH